METWGKMLIGLQFFLKQFKGFFTKFSFAEKRVLFFLFLNHTPHLSMVSIYGPVVFEDMI